jgi:hypothetical protein
VASRDHRTRVLLLACIAPGVVGLLLGPAVMAPQFASLQPVLGGNTLLLVEMTNALLIDFPMAAIAAFIACRLLKTDDLRTGAAAGAFFLAVFIAAILGCIVLGRFIPFFGWLALNDGFPPAMASAGQLLGPNLASALAAFLVFDFTLCALAGMAGAVASGALGRARGDGTPGAE